MDKLKREEGGMTEMTRLCAEAMGYAVYGRQGDQAWDVSYAASDPHRFIYAPLTNDQQAMALVKKFKLRIFPPDYTKEWGCDRLRGGYYTLSENLNRAIVTCVARMQARGRGYVKEIIS